MKAAQNDTSITISSYLKYFEQNSDALVETIREMVEMESPSSHKASVDILGAWLAARFATLGGVVRVHEQQHYGNHLQIDLAGSDAKRKPVLLLGHFDTVYELGTLAKMPCKRYWRTRM